jgi:hypothetical protein
VKGRRFLALLTVMLACVPGFGASLSTDAIEAHVGMYALGDWTGGTNGLAYPLFLLGASMTFDLDALPPPWVLTLGLDFLGAEYEWNDVDRRAQISEPEAAASFFTVGMLVSPRIGARFALGETVAMGASAGLDLLIRFPFSPFSGASIADEQLPALLYFIAGRFLYPELGGWMTWKATKDVELAFALRSLWPVYRAWSPEVTGWQTILHEVIFAGTLGMTFRLKKTATIGEKKEEPAGTEPAAP